jgi:hypothetical protein
MVQLGGYGNAVVPAVAELAGRIIAAREAVSCAEYAA